MEGFFAFGPTKILLHAGEMSYLSRPINKEFTSGVRRFLASPNPDDAQMYEFDRYTIKEMALEEIMFLFQHREHPALKFANFEKQIVMESLREGRLDVLQFLKFQGYNIKKKEEGLLEEAVGNDQTEMVKYLVENGEEIKIEDVVESVGEAEMHKYLFSNFKDKDELKSVEGYDEIIFQEEKVEIARAMYLLGAEINHIPRIRSVWIQTFRYLAALGSNIINYYDSLEAKTSSFGLRKKSASQKISAVLGPSKEKALESSLLFFRNLYIKSLVMQI